VGKVVAPHDKDVGRLVGLGLIFEILQPVLGVEVGDYLFLIHSLLVVNLWDHIRRVVMIEQGVGKDFICGAFGGELGCPDKLHFLRHASVLPVLLVHPCEDHFFEA